MKYVVDEIIGKIATLENVDDRTRININIDLLPDDIYEGCVLVYNDGYVIDQSSENERRKRISEKFDKLKKN